MNKILSNLPKYLVFAILISGVVIVLGKVTDMGGETNAMEVNVPELSAVSKEGKNLFEKNCMVCHGKNAAGTNQGPSFISPIYRPNHHADQTFVLAAQRGARAHHWPFGNMPPQPQVNEPQVLKIVEYIRALQRANGIK